MKQREPVFWIAIFMTLLGSVAIFIGEVWTIGGVYAVPAAILLLRAFILIGGSQLRARGFHKKANFWMVVAATSAFAYSGLIFFGRWMEPVHVGLQSLNILLIGVELYAGDLQSEPTKVLGLRNVISGLKSELEKERNRLAQAMQELNEASKNEEVQIQRAENLESELARLEQELSRKVATLQELTEQASHAMQTVSRLNALGIERIKSNRYLAINWPCILNGKETADCAVTGDTENQLEARIQKNLL